MEFLRSDLAEVAVYEPGRPIEEVAAELGFSPEFLVLVASNENPYQPFDEVVEVMARAVAGINRYPDNHALDLRTSLARHLGVDLDNLWFGAGSGELIRLSALAVGGPGREVVFPWPSFAMYPLCARYAMMTSVKVPLTADHGLDPDALLAAIGPDTVLMYICNPNNPSGSYLPADEVSRLIEKVPERVLVVLDEAYYEYVTASDYRGTVLQALERPNLITLRTFSKIYGLAALRVGYAVGQAETIRQLRRVQSPFTVTSVGQAGAVEALRHQDQIEARISENARERDRMEKGLASMGIRYVPSQANFIYFAVGMEAGQTAERFLARGVIIRAFPGEWARVSVGSPRENERFLAAAAEVAAQN
ncbi:MAG: histidinol-phosphate transaminase [Actinomycetia bacterium]|nr:histidinol-phosphate transaminase [Actinomycetes bacterium]